MINEKIYFGGTVMKKIFNGLMFVHGLGLGALVLAVLVIAPAPVHAQRAIPALPPLPAWVASSPLLSSQVQIFYDFYEKAQEGADLSKKERMEVIEALTDIVENFKDELPKTTVDRLLLIKTVLMAFQTKHDGITKGTEARLEILKHHHIIAFNILRGDNFTDVGPFVFNLINKSNIIAIMIHMKADLLLDFLSNELAFEDEKFWQQRRKDLLVLIDLENDIIKEIEVLSQEMLAAIYSYDELKDNYDFYRKQYDRLGGGHATLRKKNANMVKFLNRLKWQKPPLPIRVE